MQTMTVLCLNECTNQLHHLCIFSQGTLYFAS
jgi:hypothetical protein